MQAPDSQNEKLKNAIIYFVSHDKKTVKITKLMKLLYYLDFRHYRETGYSVTGQKYMAWPKGPVPADVWHEIKNETDRGCGVKDVAKILPVQPNIDSFGYDLRLKQSKFSDRAFTPRELRILREVSEMFKDIPASMMVQASHQKNDPWDQTIKNKPNGSEISYDLILDDSDPERIARIKEDQQDRKRLQEIFGVVL